MKKKNKGGIDDILTSIMTISIVLILLYCMIPFFTMIHARQEINAVARPFLLDMETKGYLSTEDSILLKREITNRVSNVKSVTILPETNLTEAERASYGERVKLVFDTEFETFSISLISVVQPEASVKSYTFNYNEATIAKGGGR